MNIAEKAKDIFKSSQEPVVEIVSEMFLEGIAGTVAPGVVSCVLAYKQRRQERMFECFMIEVSEKLALFEEKLSLLDSNELKEFKDKYFGIVSDYVLEEVQTEKIKYIVNGFINLSSIKHISEDFVLSYYDTLKELRMHDIVVLKFYYDLYSFFGLERKKYTDVIRELNIEYEQFEAIREKLLRVGLLTTKREQNQDDLYENMVKIQKNLEKLESGKKVRLDKLKTVDKRDSFRISKFGNKFIEFFINEVS